MFLRRMRSKSPAVTRSSAVGIVPISYFDSMSVNRRAKLSRSVCVSPKMASHCSSADTIISHSCAYSCAAACLPPSASACDFSSNFTARFRSCKSSASAFACAPAVSAVSVFSAKAKSGADAARRRAFILRRRSFTSSSYSPPKPSGCSRQSASCVHALPRSCHIKI